MSGVDNGGSDGYTLHIVMLPWLALGHILPFFHLSKRLAEDGHRVSFLCTPKNIRRLPPLPPGTAPLIDLVGLPLPPVDGLPATAEATIDLPSQDLRPYLRMAYDALETQLSTFLQKASSSPSPPDWIVFDYASYWVPRVAARFGVPCAFLGLHSAAVFSFIGPPSVLKGEGDGVRTTPEELTVKPRWIPFESRIVYRPYEARELFRPGVVPDASGVSEAYRFGASIEGCDVVALRSSPEAEPRWLRLLEEIYGKAVVPVGLLPPPTRRDPDHHRSNEPAGWAHAFDWLERQQHGSAVYAAFGSEAKLSPAQVFEIAKGLELSQFPFVLVLRRPLDGSAAAGLPEGFEDRTRGQGVVHFGWAPQAEILAHPSVGGFLTHGGWSSIVEGLAAGVGMALLPLMFDQGLNCRDLGERGVGVEVRRSEEDGSFAGEDIAETLRAVMVEGGGGEGERLRAEAMGVFGSEELQREHVRRFVGHLKEYRGQRGESQLE